MDSHDFSLHLYPDGYYYMTSVAYGGCEEPANLGCDQTKDHCGFQVRIYGILFNRSTPSVSKLVCLLAYRLETFARTILS